MGSPEHPLPIAARKVLRFPPRCAPSPRSAEPHRPGSSPRVRGDADSGPHGGQRRPVAPHLAQLLVDELLQLRGFLRGQRHADAGASPRTLSAAGAPTTRRASARLGAAVGLNTEPARPLASRSSRGTRRRVRRGAGQEARLPLRWRPTVVLKRPRTARRQGCPPLCRITSTCRSPSLTVPTSRPQRAPTPGQSLRTRYRP